MVVIGFVLTCILAAAPDTSARAIGRVVDAAEHGVQGDSATPMVARWRAQLQRDSTDPAARLGLATVARMTFDYATADRLYRALDGVPRYTGQARLGEATGLLARGRVGDAGGWYVRAVDAARADHDSTTIVKSLIGMAATLNRTRGPAAAASALAGAAKLIPRDAYGLQAAFQCTGALIQITAGAASSRAVAASGVALARRAQDVHAESVCLYVEMNDEVRGNDIAGAVALSDTLQGLVTRVHDRAGQAVVGQWKGYGLVQQGDYGGAARTLGRALADARAAQHEPAAGAIAVNLANVYVALGDLQTASRYVDSAEVALRAAGDEWGPVTLLGLRGTIALMVGDTAAAHAAYTAQVTRARAVSNVVGLADGETGLADLATRAGDWAAARAALDSCTMFQRRFHATGWQGYTTFNLATVALAQGRLAEAEKDADQYRAALRPDQHDERYFADARLADIHLRQGDTLRAERELRTASDELDSWRATLGESELRALAFQRGNRFGGIDPGGAMVIAGIARAGRIGPAFALAEHRRARDLSDELRRTDAAATVASGNMADLVGVVQNGLPDDSTALLEYATGHGVAPTTLFAITRHGARAYVLPPVDSLADVIERFAALVESGLGSDAPARQLGARLLGPALAELAPFVTRLVLVPDDALYRVPFAALRLQNGQYVVERAAVSTTPSALVAVELWSRPVDTRPVALLAFGDAHMPREIDGGPDAAVGRTGFDLSAGLPRLRASADEARLAARFAPRAVVRLRDEASETYLKGTRLDSFRVIHFATHALIDDRAITRTALALAPDRTNDGFVTVSDLAALHLHADLVILSACRAAGGVIVAGEGVRGLTAPLIAAGARAVVASQWEIGDRATVGTMAAFYHALADGLSATEALRRAQLAALHRGALPREWAAFVLVGDPTVRVPLHLPAFEWVRDWLR